MRETLGKHLENQKDNRATPNRHMPCKT